MISGLRIGGFVAAVLFSIVCAAAPDKPAAGVSSPYRILESFGVGNAVYVRSLAVDRAHNSLWVGTSVGVHEVDLKTRDPIHTFTRKEGLANEFVFSIARATSGSVPTAAALPVTVTANGRPIFPCTAWRTIGSIILPSRNPV